ncbi:hypothetical protein MFIFM68171_00466 [Madurella fahalii]|uniref:Uncharacterized protein n=1 Tax=Madurella fahalii TaxID=1157608 RepID=A0ABQ0FXM7_9PEZI
MDPDTFSTDHLRLRGGAFEDGYGYNPNFTRRISPAGYERDSRPKPSTSRSSSSSSKRPWVPPGGSYRPVPPDPQHESRVRRLGIRDSLLRPAPRPIPPRPNGGEGEEGGGGRGEGPERPGAFAYLSTPPWTWHRWWWLSALAPFPLPWDWARPGPRWPERTLDELDRGGWRPTRVGFEIERWPSGAGEELESTWFEMLYSHLYVRAGAFAREYFGYKDIVPTRGSSRERVWLEGGFSKQFRWYAQRVAKQDNHAGGWDALLKMEKHRRYLVTGVIGKVLEMCVFDELLFGAEEDQKRMLEAQDRCTLDMEGYERTELRCQTVRAIMADAILTPNFWPCVDQLTLQLTTLLLPLIRLMDKHFPESRAKSLQSIHQDLHAIVSEAALMSIAIRWSHDIFRFSSPFLGEVWDTDQQHVDDAIYNLSKSRTDRDDKAAEKRYRRGLSKSKEAERSTPLALIDRGEASIITALNRIKAAWNFVTGQADEQNAVGDPASTSWRAPSRMGKVQIVVWPMLQRFATAGQVDQISGAAEGQHITTLLKAQCIYYSGRIDQPAEQSEDHPTLDEWIRSNKRHRIWMFVGDLRYVAAIAAWLGFGYFLIERNPTIARPFWIPIAGLLQFARWVARSVLLFLIEVAIVVLRLAVTAFKVTQFLVSATRNTISYLAFSALRANPRLAYWTRSIGSAEFWDSALNDNVTLALTYPNLSWKSIKGMVKAVINELDWRIIEAPAGL